jgi:Flp pilus assembly protein TadG
MTRSNLFRLRRRGQSAILTALVVPFLALFVLLVVEVSTRWLEVATIEDALQQSARSTVQLLDYAALAENRDGMRATQDCRNVTWNQNSACRALLSVARRFLVTNLTGVRGLAEPPETIADRVRWTVLPNGGTCSYTSTAVRPVTETTPLICAEVRPALTGVVGWGVYRPLIVAADTLDPVN